MASISTCQSTLGGAVKRQQEIDVRERLKDITVSIGIPAYNEGPGIVHALRSVLDGLDGLGLSGAAVILSDSSATTSTADAARAYADESGMHLILDRSERRRSEKEARNALMARATSDILIQIDADVVLPAASLFHLLRCLTEPPIPLIAVGTAGPDPQFNSRNCRGGAWQLNATRRYASWQPDDCVRAEGACWGAWRSFYEHYRFPLGTDSPHADLCLARHVSKHGIPARNCWRAVVHKVPPATLYDFFLQTQRWYAASEGRSRALKELGAAVVEAVKDPLGAALYIHARIWAAREQRRRRPRWEEEWDVTHSTKRR